MTRTQHTTCTVDGCEKPHEAKGFCCAHYRKFQLYGDPLGRAVRQYELICAVDGCDKSRRAMAWCSAHYRAFKKWGDVNHVPYSSLKVNRICSVEGCEERHQSNGLCDRHYRRRKTGAERNTGKMHAAGYAYAYLPEHPNAAPDGYVLEHRLLMSMMLDRPLVTGENVHHINGDRLDNRPENLELWSTVQPSGQRVEDKVRYARQILAEYGDMFPE